MQILLDNYYFNKTLSWVYFNFHVYILYVLEDFVTRIFFLYNTFSTSISISLFSTMCSITTIITSHNDNYFSLQL